MAGLSGSLIKYSGSIQNCHPKMPLQIRRCDQIRYGRHNALWPVLEMIPSERLLFLEAKHQGTVAHVGSNCHQLSFDNYQPEESFWSTMMKDTIWSVSSLFTFLAEQPSQLKYIEWPSFQSTLKTATLTLFLVALLIIALSSVDSALCYLLALLLRKTA